MSITWKGVMPALTTKFNANDELDIDLFLNNLNVQMEAGVTGVVLGGTLGEASTLSIEEKFFLLKKTVDHVNGNIPVIMNIAEGATRDAILQAQKIEKTGADGIMLLPPMRYKSDHNETVHYFKSVASATSLPIMIYNNPVDYKIEVSMEMFEELADMDNIVAVKESTRDISNVTRMINKFEDRYAIMCGVDTLAMEEILMGAKGWLAGLVCAFPFETVAIFKYLESGDVEKARKIYRWFMPLLELDIHPKLVQYIKLCEAEVGLGSEYVRAPRLKLTGEERKRILQIIHTTLENRPVL